MLLYNERRAKKYALLGNVVKCVIVALVLHTFTQSALMEKFSHNFLQSTINSFSAQDRARFDFFLSFSFYVVLFPAALTGVFLLVFSIEKFICAMNIRRKWRFSSSDFFPQLLFVCLYSLFRLFSYFQHSLSFSISFFLLCTVYFRRNEKRRIERLLHMQS